MGLRSIWRHEKDIPPPTTRQRLNRDAISALFWIILTAIVGIILMSLLGMSLRYGLLSSGRELDATATTADEALSILGNVASAAIGGLVGWLTRDQLDQKDTKLPPEPTADEIALPIDVEELDELPPPDVTEEDLTEVVDEDFLWPDEPDGDEDVDFDDEEVRDA